MVTSKLQKGSGQDRTTCKTQVTKKHNLRNPRKYKQATKKAQLAKTQTKKTQATTKSQLAQETQVVNKSQGARTKVSKKVLQLAKAQSTKKSQLVEPQVTKAQCN